MDIQSIKIDLIHWLTQVQDKSVIEKLQNLKEQEDNFEMSLDQQKELDERLSKYESGNMKFSSWGTVKNRIRGQAKDEI